MNLATLPSSKESAKNFYPTPDKLAADLLDGIDWAQVESALEPSAGKGDLSKEITARMKSARYARSNAEIDLDCVEIDPDLRHILTGNKYRVVHDDFLTFHTYKRYGAIIMNPPFDRGAEHLLKALEMQQHGGYIACLLNAETIDNPYTLARQHLKKLLAQYEATITYRENEFASAERKTGVRIAIVKINIPFESDPESDILEGMRAEQEQRKATAPAESTGLIKDDFIEAIVDRYNLEAGAGCKLIKEYRALRPYLIEDVDVKRHSSPMLSLIMGSVYARNNDDADENKYICALRKKYWTALFASSQFMKNMTSNLQNELMGSVEQLRDYDFSLYNIYTIRVNMQKKLMSGIHNTIISLFDDWTQKYHYDVNSKNRHYFDGWKTNDAFAVNKRVIIPFRKAFSDWDGRFHPTNYGNEDTLCDIEKVFDYLSGNTPYFDGIHAALGAAEKDGTTRNIQMRYFKVTFYKKGTCHIEFTDMDVLHKFNLYAAKDKNWLPPCYGKKRYADMRPDEQAVVESFEGKASYENVLARSDYFLSEPTDNGALRLTAGQ